MPTIAMTERYKELSYRHLKLRQLYSAMSELRLHTNKAVDEEVASYYHAKLYTWGDCAPFLTASLESMMQVFYIELDGFIGAFWDVKKTKVVTRKNDQGSIGSYLYDESRTARKNSAKVIFEAFLKEESNELVMIHDTRHTLAHFEKLKVRNKSLVPGGTKIKEILDKLADILFLLGYRNGNKPHYVEDDDEAAVSVRKLVDRLIANDEKSIDMREKYTEKRDEWLGK